MKVSILICSFAASKHLGTTLDSICRTFPREAHDLEILVDIETKRTGLANSTHRYMNLWKKSTGDIIVKSDDDVMYYQGWFGQCFRYLMEEPSIGYIGPISHFLMKRIGIRRANDERIPIDPEKFNFEKIVSGMCWVFKRDLWEKFPYTLVSDTWRLDGVYSNLINNSGTLKTAVLDGALVKHLGQDRYKGIKTDVPGGIPTDAFRKANPNGDYKIF